MSKGNNKIAYVSGPMTGILNYNFDEFQKAQHKLEKDGYIVLNPHEIGKELYEKWSKVEVSSEEKRKEMWCEFMKLDIQHLMLADCVFVLRNWESSNGSVIELLNAQKLNIPIYYIDNYEPFETTFQIVKLDKVTA